MKKIILAGLTVMGMSGAWAQSSSITQIIEAVNKNNYRMRYFRDNKTKVVLTRSDADILSDGDISKVNKDSLIKDPHRQNQLFSGLKLNPYVVSYSVIPDELKHRQVLKNNGIKMRSLYYVYDIKTGQSGFGILADIGPGGQVTNGEFSVHQIKALGLPVDKKTATGGKDANDIITIIFPHSDQIISLNDIQRYIDDGNQEGLQSRIEEEGQKLVAKYSTSLGKGLTKAIEAIKANTSSVKDFD